MIVTEETIKLLQKHCICQTLDGGYMLKANDQLDGLGESFYESKNNFSGDGTPTIVAYSYKCLPFSLLCKIGRNSNIVHNV